MESARFQKQKPKEHDDFLDSRSKNQNKNAMSFDIPNTKTKKTQGLSRFQKQKPKKHKDSQDSKSKDKKHNDFLDSKRKKQKIKRIFKIPKAKTKTNTMTF